MESCSSLSGRSRSPWRARSERTQGNNSIFLIFIISCPGEWWGRSDSLLHPDGSPHLEKSTSEDSFFVGKIIFSLFFFSFSELPVLYLLFFFSQSLLAGSSWTPRTSWRAGNERRSRRTREGRKESLKEQLGEGGFWESFYLFPALEINNIYLFRSGLDGSSRDGKIQQGWIHSILFSSPWEKNQGKYHQVSHDFA